MMNDTCQDVIGFLDDYVSGNLVPEQRAVFETHLGRCPYCRDYLATYRDTIALGRGLADPAHDRAGDEPPAELVEAITASLLAHRDR
jgi:anti-sigma factor RsiW